MITCKQASHLVSESYERKLSWRERIALRLHLWLCNNCRRFEKQILFLQYAIRKGQQEGHLPIDKPLPPKSVERIRQALHKHREDKSD